MNKNALIADGPFRGWPLGGAMLISQSKLTPVQCKEKLIADCERHIARYQAEIERIKTLPDVITMGKPQ